MRIAIVTQQYGSFWSGVGKYTHLLVKALVADGHDITVVCPENAGVRNDALGPRIAPCSTWRKDPTHGKWFSFSYEASRLLPRLHREKPFDVIHFSDFREAIFFNGPPRIVVGTVHDYCFAVCPNNPYAFKKYYMDWKTRYLYYQFVKNADKRAINKIDYYICNTYFVRDVLATKYSISNDKMRVIHIGMESSPLVATKKAEIQDPQITRILFVGSNLQRKGIGTLIEASRLMRREGYALSIDIIGENRMRSKIMDRVAALGLSDVFNFHGWVDNSEVHSYYEKADIFVLPSQLESYGLVYLESMSYGVPVIAGDSGGVRELIKDGTNGIIIDPHDVVGLKDKLLMLIKDKVLYSKLVNNGFATVAQNNIRTTVTQTVELYKQMKEKR